MDDPKLRRLQDRATTIAVVPSALIAAAALSGLIGGQDISRAVSSLLFTGLLAVYVAFVPAGRRSGVGSFLLGGLVILSFIPIDFAIMDRDFSAGLDIFEFLLLVGLDADGGPDAPLFAVAAIWWLSLMVCIGTVVFARSIVLFFVLGRTSLEDSVP